VATDTVAPMRVLVVDDEVDLTDAIARGLRHDGYAVDVAYDGDEALEKVAVNQYDLVCLDITMPGTDGREVCRAVRADASLEVQPRVLMLTARDALEDRVAGLDDGADDLVAEHERQAGVGELAVRDVEIGAADPAGGDAEQELARTRAWDGELGGPERAARGFEQHGVHGANVAGPSRCHPERSEGGIPQVKPPCFAQGDNDIAGYRYLSKKT
jgi:CheY-like chemotaxis protein